MEENNTTNENIYSTVRPVDAQTNNNQINTPILTTPTPQPNNIDSQQTVSSSPNIEPTQNIQQTIPQQPATQNINQPENIQQPITQNTIPSPENIQPQYEEVVINTTPKEKEIRTDSYFDGNLLELFGWTFLKNILMIITLGIATPWGECMMLNYEISHTVINGKRLKFVGNGGNLFIERFKWIFFSIITLGIYTLWIPVKKTKWIVSNIHFEDEPYVKEESYFDGKVLQLVGINILCNFLNVISLFTLFPFTVCIKLRWIAKHSIINRKKIVFDGMGIGLLGKYLLWLFLTIITFGIYGLWLNIKMIKWKVKHSRLKLVGEKEQKDKSLIVMIIIFVVLFIGSIILLITNPFNFEFNPHNFGPQSSYYNDNYYNNNYYHNDYYDSGALNSYNR